MQIILSEEQFDVLWNVVLQELESSEAKHRKAKGLPEERSATYWLDQIRSIKAAMEGSNEQR